MLAALSAIGAAYGVGWAVAPRYQESTGDAYVSGNLVQVTPEIAGTVVAISADDNQFVRVGRLVVELDDSDARVAVERARVNLERTVREIRGRSARAAGLYVRSDRTSISNNPAVLAADDQLHEASLQVARTKLVASVSGFVAKRTVELGQSVSPGVPLIEIVPLNELWVVANFRERQLAAMHVGQPATLRAHSDGGNVTYHGTVAGLAASTVSSVGLPALQNATGDHIKAAQRIPVYIALDSRELVEHPLPIGLSMTVDVDTHERGGARPLELASASNRWPRPGDSR